MKLKFVEHKDVNKAKAFLDAVQCAFKGDKTDSFGEATKETRLRATNSIKGLFTKYIGMIDGSLAPSVAS
jgi:hypothetical protein